MSDPGASSPLPWPPTAETATPGASGPKSSTTARSTASARARATRPPLSGSVSGSASFRARSARRRLMTARVSSDGVGAHLPRADPVYLLGRQHEHLAVADLAGARRLHDRVDYAVDLVVLGHDLHLDLRHEVHLVFSPPVDLGMATLAPE